MDILDIENIYNNALVLRGGSWGYHPWRCRSALRIGDAPSSRIYDLGFRVAFRLD